MTSWTPQPTDDGSFTFFSETFGEAFHSRQGAKTEALSKFAQATELAARAQRDSLRLLDVCYGLGYNTAAALETIWAVNPTCTIEVYGLEWDETVPRAAVTPAFLAEWSERVQAGLVALASVCAPAPTAHDPTGTTPHLNAQLLIGDARQTIQQLPPNFQADAIFFDPFSPRRCPQLWTVEFFQQVARHLAPDGKLATYSRSASVRTALLAVGLHIGTIPLSETDLANTRQRHLSHEWSQGTVAAFTPQGLPPLSQMEQEHLQTRAAIPYRDPTLSDAAATILERHRQEQAQSQRESTSSWRRRWGIDS